MIDESKVTISLPKADYDRLVQETEQAQLGYQSKLEALVDRMLAICQKGGDYELESFLRGYRNQLTRKP